jgi:hypothetical protein
MSDQQKEESQKTVVSFIVGLLVGGLLVWAFTGTPNDDKAKDLNTEDKKEVKAEDKNSEATKSPVGEDEPEATKLPVGEGKATVAEANAGMTVSLSDVTFPTKEGWVGVRSMSEGKLGMLLGVARFSDEQGLLPKEVTLLTPTVPGREYAIVFYSESGDRKFNLAEDIQNSAEVATFTAK